MKIFITGNMGYVGPVVATHLREKYPEGVLIGCDTGFFAGCLIDPLVFPEVNLSQQILTDVRQLSQSEMTGVDAVVHLAAISNDPMGRSYETVTDQINYRTSVEIARKAKNAGVKHFVFASSCSVYGATGKGARREEDPLNPLTAYAKSKIAAEKSLKTLADDRFVVSCLRFATACGFSPRLRLDLVLNDFVACALATGKIEILSDGTPWRPLIDVKDMARAIGWAIERPAENGGAFLTVNIGSHQGNFQVREIAEIVRDQLPAVEVSVSKDAQPDNRSYKVDFSLFEQLAPDYQPQSSLPTSVRELVDGLTRGNFRDSDFRNSHFIRLNALRKLEANGSINSELIWQNS